MSIARESLAAAAYALFALNQPISLDEIAEAARDGGFPLAATKTPGWFAAAASHDSSLLETAPELLVLSSDGDPDAVVDVSGFDLIHVYAPELQAVEEMEEPVVPRPEEPSPPVEKPRTSTQTDLLKELADLDG